MVVYFGIKNSKSIDLLVFLVFQPQMGRCIENIIPREAPRTHVDLVDVRTCSFTFARGVLHANVKLELHARTWNSTFTRHPCPRAHVEFYVHTWNSVQPTWAKSVVFLFMTFEIWNLDDGSFKIIENNIFVTDEWDPWPTKWYIQIVKKCPLVYVYTRYRSQWHSVYYT